MKGIVFNLLEAAVTARHGEAVWETLLDRTGLTGARASLGDYSDDEIEALAGAA